MLHFAVNLNQTCDCSIRHAALILPSGFEMLKFQIVRRESASKISLCRAPLFVSTCARVSTGLRDCAPSLTGSSLPGAPERGQERKPQEASGRLLLIIAIINSGRGRPSRGAEGEDPPACGGAETFGEDINNSY